MYINAISPLISHSLAQMAGYGIALPLVSQASFKAQAPFEAYLLSLTSPAALAQAAVLRQTAPTPTASGTTSSALSALNPVTPQAAAPRTAGPAPSNNAATVAALYSFSAAALGAAQESPDNSAPAGAELVSDSDLAALDTSAAPQDTETAAASTAQADSLAADAITAGNAATFAANAATNALYEADAASQLAQGSGNLATDAAAMFMGAGQQSGLQPESAAALSAYQTALEDIPAVSGAVASPALDSSTSSPQSAPQAPNTIHHTPAPMAMNPTAVPDLDLLG